jgi:hypothetical protein
MRLELSGQFGQGLVHHFPDRERFSVRSWRRPLSDASRIRPPAPDCGRMSIRGGGMSLLQTRFAMNVHFRVATGTGIGGKGVGAETLQGSSGLNRGAVHGMILGHRASGPGFYP